jgi:cbb3-type cytochrome oxidase maturation protein
MRVEVPPGLARTEPERYGCGNGPFQLRTPDMNSPMEGSTFLFMWLGFLILMIGCIGAFFLWAMRGGQFSQQDRARYLALQSAIPDSREPCTKAVSSSGGDLHDA